MVHALYFCTRLPLTACCLRQGPACSLSGICTRVNSWWGPPWEASHAGSARQMLWMEEAPDSSFYNKAQTVVEEAVLMAAMAGLFAVCLAFAELGDGAGNALSAPGLVACCSILADACAGCAAALLCYRAVKLHSAVHPGGRRVPMEQHTLDRLTALLAKGALDKEFSLMECVLAWARRGLLFGELVFGGALMLMPVYLGGLYGWLYAAMGLGNCAFFLHCARGHIIKLENTTTV